MIKFKESKNIYLYSENIDMRMGMKGPRLTQFNQKDCVKDQRLLNQKKKLIIKNMIIFRNFSLYIKYID